MIDSLILAALGKMAEQIQYDSRKHRYTVGGETYPSVTTITGVLDKPALLHWAGGLAVDAAKDAATAWLARPSNPLDLIPSIENVRGIWTRETRRAGDIGTEVHELIQHETRRMLGMESQAPAVSDESRHVFSGWVEWARKANYKPVAVEAPLFSPANRYAGRFDVLASILGGSLAVLDWKTVAGDKLDRPLYPEMELQNLAYRAALREHGIMAEGWIVKLPKDGTAGPRSTHVPWSDAGFEAFLGLQKAHAWLRRRER